MKYIDFKRYKFSTITKKVNIIRYKFLKLIDFGRYNFRKIYKYFNYRKLNFYKLVNFRSLIFYKLKNFYKLKKKINFKNYRYLPIYFAVSVILIAFVYVTIPVFYSYDKSQIEKIICKNYKIECLIKGVVKYSFYPTPRIIIKDLVINDLSEKKNALATVKSVAIKLSINNLLNKKKQNFKKIELKNFEINFNLKNIKKYKNIVTKKINFAPVNFRMGKVIFFDGINYVATISETNLDLKFQQNSSEAILKGNFLNGDILFKLNSEKVDNKTSTELILKISELNLLTKVNFSSYEKNKNIVDGNILIKKNKNRITAIFDFKDNEFTINKSNLKNTFMDGSLEGKIKLLPYFNFNLEVNLNTINFTKLYNYFLILDENNKKKIFKINNKINGKLNLSADKIYSKYNLVKSLESRLNFSNGNILIEQFLINLGKLGASDVLGSINNDKKFTHFKFESNIFVDNQKKFLSKFGIYNKKNLPSNLFISGNFDLDNVRLTFYEISDNEKLNKEDVNYIEKEFNNLMLQDGYETLFDFPNFKEFIKSITDTIN